MSCDAYPGSSKGRGKRRRRSILGRLAGITGRTGALLPEMLLRAAPTLACGAGSAPGAPLRLT